MIPVRHALFVLALAALMPAGAASQIQFVSGDVIEFGDANVSIEIRDNFTINASVIAEYADTVQLGPHNISISSTGAAPNTTMWAFNPSSSYTAGETVLKLGAQANTGSNVTFQFTGFNTLENGEYVLTIDGNETKSFGRQGVFTWWHDSWSSENFTVRCDTDTNCTAVEDTTAPTVSVSHSPSSPTDMDQVTVSATASDENSGLNTIRLFVDGSSVKTCSASPCSVTSGPYSSGSHTYRAKAEDNEGNVGTGTGSFSVQQESTDDSSSGSGGGDSSSGGGGGFSLSEPERTRSVSPSDMRVFLKTGGQKTVEIVLKNNGSTEESFDVSIDETLRFFTDARSDSYTVEEESNKTVAIPLSVSAIAKPAVYRGHVYVVSGDRDWEIPVAVVVRGAEEEISVNIDVETVDAEDGLIKYRTELYNLGTEPQTVSTTITLRHSNGTVLYTTEHGELLENESIQFHDLRAAIQPGQYVLELSASTADTTKGASTGVFVQKTQQEQKLFGLNPIQLVQTLFFSALFFAFLTGVLLLREVLGEREEATRITTDVKQHAIHAEDEPSAEPPGTQDLEARLAEKREEVEELNAKEEDMEYKLREGYITQEEFDEFESWAQQDRERILEELEELKRDM